ncbi:hypothetical protein BC826DRAFT_1001405 [Russula brevipes]|nr:hypothetical protein BC826DRAFT_1001405 [Russula brevipes]
MLFRSTLVITLLVPILALLASVRAQVDIPMGLQYVNHPKEGEHVKRNESFTISFEVLWLDIKNSPPWQNIFFLYQVNHKRIWYLGHKELSVTGVGEVMNMTVEFPRDKSLDIHSDFKIKNLYTVQLNWDIVGYSPSFKLC